MPDNVSAIWSAIAGTGSAIAAISILKIQHSNMVDAARPELILSDWNRKSRAPDSDKIDDITIGRISNFGNGVALHTTLSVEDDSGAVASSLTRVATIPKGEETEFNAVYSLFWNNIKSSSKVNIRVYLTTVKLYSWCTKGYRYETLYELLVAESTETIISGLQYLAPGVYLRSRITTKTPIWKIKSISYIKNVKSIITNLFDKIKTGVTMSDFTFKQAIVLAAIPSLIGIAATYYSKEVSDNQAVIQARITERDLTHSEALAITTEENPIYAYMIPVASNTAWANYYVCRTEKKESRLICAGKQKDQKLDLTPDIVKNHVNFGF